MFNSQIPNYFCEWSRTLDRFSHQAARWRNWCSDTSQWNYNNCVLIINVNTEVSDYLSWSQTKISLWINKASIHPSVHQFHQCINSSIIHLLHPLWGIFSNVPCYFDISIFRMKLKHKETTLLFIQSDFFCLSASNTSSVLWVRRLQSMNGCIHVLYLV